MKTLQQYKQELLLDPEWEFLREQVSCIDHKGYLRIRNKLLHHFILPNEGREKPVDHKNRNKLDNQRDNLSYTTQSGNALNQELRKDNTSGLKGVTWERSRARWLAQARFQGNRYHLYGGPDFFLACCARKSYEANHVC